MSFLKQALITAVMAGTMAAPALATDFEGSAGCVVTDTVQGKNYVVAQVSEIKRDMWEQMRDAGSDALSWMFHHQQRHDSLSATIAGRNTMGAQTSKDLAVMRVTDETEGLVQARVVRDEPLWSNKDVTIYKCEMQNADEVRSILKDNNWHVNLNGALGLAYVDPHTKKTPAGEVLMTTDDDTGKPKPYPWRFQVEIDDINAGKYPELGL